MEDVVTHAAPKKGQQSQKLDTNIHTKKKMSSGLHFTEWKLFLNKIVDWVL